MTLPTRDQLNDAVNLDFFDQYPDAPRQLDPNDPDQAELVEAWNEIYRAKANGWTDEVFWRFFPDAGYLSKDGPEDAQLREYWCDIRNQITEEEAAKFDWNTDPSAATTPVEPQLDSVRQFEHAGYDLTFNGAVELDDVERWLWPDGNQSGAHMKLESANVVRLTHVTWEQIQSMREDVANKISEAGILTAE
jgi:hypothetical protein